jgi:hypothetical protein
MKVLVPALLLERLKQSAIGVLQTSAPSLSDAHAIHVIDLHSVTVFGTVDILM